MPPHWIPLVVCVAGIAAGALQMRDLRRSGVNPWALPSGDDAHGFLGRCYFWLVGAALFLLVTWTLAPGWSLRVFGALPLLLHPVPGWGGIALMAVGVALVFLAQRELAAAWRVGIPTRKRPTLVTSGPFRYSRNPVSLGILVAAVGIAFAIPHALSLAILAASSVALSVQVRLEEAYLEGWLGADYLAYKERTRRWVSLG